MSAAIKFLSVSTNIEVFILANMYHLHTYMSRYFGINHTRFKARCEFFILLFHTFDDYLYLYVNQNQLKVD